MSTYFETFNETTSLLQISDNYLSIGVVRSGTLTAKFNDGVLYGFILQPNELYAVFRTDNDTLIVTETILYNGQRICYVASVNGAPVKYKVFGPSQTLAPMQSGSGMEIYNESGQIVFSSNYETGSVLESHSLPPKNLVTYDDGTYAQLNDGQWDPVVINDDRGSKYILSIQMPFGYCAPNSNGVAAKDNPNINWLSSRYYAGYTFQGGQIKTMTRSGNIPEGKMKTVIGGGSLNQIGYIYRIQQGGSWYFSYEAGIYAAAYCFTVIDF